MSHSSRSERRQPAARSAASHATEESVGRSSQLQLAPRPRGALCVGSPTVKEKPPSDSEQAARDAICASVKLAEPPEFEPNGRDTAPDWRMWITDDETAAGREIDVEVVSSTNRDVREFIKALLQDGKARTKKDPRLAWEWIISVGDLEPDRRDRTLGKLIDAVVEVLASGESKHHSPEQTQRAAQSAIDLSLEVQSLCGEFRYVRVDPFKHVGKGGGMVRIYGVPLRSYWVHPAELVPLVQHCIDYKSDPNRRWDGAADRRWLAVVLEDDSASLFNDLYGPDAPPPPAVLDVVPSDYFHEVWLVTWTLIGRDHQEGFTVLRLSEGGSEQKRHVVPRLVVAA